MHIPKEKWDSGGVENEYRPNDAKVVLNEVSMGLSIPKTSDFHVLYISRFMILLVFFASEQQTL